METKLASELTKVAKMEDNQSVILTDETGGTTRIGLEELKKSILGNMDLSAMSDGVFIMYHGKSNDTPYMVKPEKWSALQTSGEKAEGVVVVDGGKMLVVAPTEAPTSLLWSSAEVDGGNVIEWDRKKALGDWNGSSVAAIQAVKPECAAEIYAPGFCAKYSRVNANGKGLDAGKWWLPSEGELMCMFANMKKINYALSFINNSMPLAETYYWSSSEYSVSGAWYLGLGSGSASGGTKAKTKCRVRAVSAF